MKFAVTICQVNPDFDQEYADQYHFVKESENNTKCHWSKTTEISKAEDFEVIENANFELALKDNRNFLIPNVYKLLCYDHQKNPVIEFVISKSLLEKTHSVYNKQYKTSRFYFYLNDNEFVNLTENIYLSLSDFPKELLITKE